MKKKQYFLIRTIPDACFLLLENKLELLAKCALIKYTNDYKLSVMKFRLQWVLKTKFQLNNSSWNN